MHTLQNSHKETPLNLHTFPRNIYKTVYGPGMTIGSPRLGTGHLGKLGTGSLGPATAVSLDYSN